MGRHDRAWQGRAAGGEREKRSSQHAVGGTGSLGAVQGALLLSPLQQKQGLVAWLLGRLVAWARLQTTSLGGVGAYRHARRPDSRVLPDVSLLSLGTGWVRRSLMQQCIPR
jgi:hypothetical protein